MRFYLQFCSNVKCESFIKGAKESHKLVGGDTEYWYGECESCGQRNQIPSPRKHGTKKQGYPHYNTSVGMTFQDKDHEKSYVKANDLDPV